MNYKLNDTFNNRELSRHRSIAKAIDARDAHLRAVKRANGRSAWLTYSITFADGSAIDQHELDHAEWLAYQRRMRS